MSNPNPDNLQVANEQLLTEKIDWNVRSLQGIEFAPGDIASGIPQFIQIDRNLRDDTFNIAAPKRDTNKNVSTVFTVNNQELSGVISSSSAKTPGGSEYSLMTAHRSLFKDLPLAKATEISARQVLNSNSPELVYSMTVFPQIESMNKNVFLGKGQFLKLQSIDSVSFPTTPNARAKWNDIVKDGTINAVVHYNTTYIVPREFSDVEGNQTLFDIYTKNDQPTSSIFADYATGEGVITATSLSKSGLKTYFQPTNDGTKIYEEKDSVPATKIGEIKIYDNQFFNYDTKKVETGYGAKAVGGLLVPYNFSGEYKENVKFTPNAAFKDLSINMSHQIDQPLLDKYDGKIILNINETDEVAGKYNIISSDKIRNLADYDPSISGLKRISH